MAQPRGLIVLKEAGTIADSVREYIQKELQVVCEIPQLKLNKDGCLLGGSDGKGGDVLDSVRDKASQNVGVVIGPDSIGTLSFTSGSTGIPKGNRKSAWKRTKRY